MGLGWLWGWVGTEVSCILGVLQGQRDVDEQSALKQVVGPIWV